MVEYVKLGDVCRILPGYAFDSNKFTDIPSPSSLPIIRIRDLLRGYSNTYTSEEYDSKYLIASGDYLIGMDGEFNLVNWTGGKALLNQRVCKIISNTPKAMERFLYYSLQRKLKDIENKTAFSTVKHISTKTIQHIEINLPSREIQQNIIKVLDTITSIIEKRKQQIALLEEAEKSLFVEMFGDPVTNPMGWDVVKLESVGVNRDAIKCGPFGTQLSKDEYLLSGVPVWGIPQINSFFKLNPDSYVSIEKADELNAYSAQPHDILMSRKGTIGKCALYPKTFPKGIIHSDVLRIRPNPSIVDSEYLTHQLHNSQFVSVQIDGVSNGAIMKGINVSKLKSIQIHLPPLSLQKEFAFRKSAIEKDRCEFRNSFIQMEELKSALMQEYFG